MCSWSLHSSSVFVGDTWLHFSPHYITVCVHGAIEGLLLFASILRCRVCRSYIILSYFSDKGVPRNISQYPTYQAAVTGVSDSSLVLHVVIPFPPEICKCVIFYKTFCDINLCNVFLMVMFICSPTILDAENWDSLLIRNAEMLIAYTLLSIYKKQAIVW